MSQQQQQQQLHLANTVRNQINLYINTKVKNHSTTIASGTLPPSIADLFISETTRNLAYFAAIRCAGGAAALTAATASSSSAGSSVPTFSGIVSEKELLVANLFNYTLRAFPPPNQQQAPSDATFVCAPGSSSSSSFSCLAAIGFFANKHSGIGAPSELKQLSSIVSVLANNSSNFAGTAGSTTVPNNNNNFNYNYNNYYSKNNYSRLPPIDPHLDVGGSGGGAGAGGVGAAGDSLDPDHSNANGEMHNNNSNNNNEGIDQNNNSNSGFPHSSEENALNSNQVDSNSFGQAQQRTSANSQRSLLPPKVTTMLSILSPVGMYLTSSGVATVSAGPVSGLGGAGGRFAHHHLHHLHHHHLHHYPYVNVSSSSASLQHILHSPQVKNPAASFDFHNHLHHHHHHHHHHLHAPHSAASSQQQHHHHQQQQHHHQPHLAHHHNAQNFSASSSIVIVVNPLTTRSRTLLPLLSCTAGMQYIEHVLRRNAKLRNAEFEGAWKYILRPRLLKDYTSVASLQQQLESTTGTSSVGVSTGSGNGNRLRYSREQFSSEIATLLGQQQQQQPSSSRANQYDRNTNFQQQQQQSGSSATGATYSQYPKVQAAGAVAVIVKSTMDGYMSKIPFVAYAQQQQQQQQQGDSTSQVTILREVSEGLLHVLSTMLIRSDEYSVRARAFEVVVNLALHAQMVDCSTNSYHYNNYNNTYSTNSCNISSNIKLILSEVEWLLAQLLEILSTHVISINHNTSSFHNHNQQQQQQLPRGGKSGKINLGQSASSCFTLPALQLDATSVRLLIAALKATLLIVPPQQKGGLARVVPCQTLSLFLQLPVVQTCSTSAFDSLCSAVLEKITGKAFDEFFSLTTTAATSVNNNAKSATRTDAAGRGQAADDDDESQRTNTDDEIVNSSTTLRKNNSNNNSNNNNTTTNSGAKSINDNMSKKGTSPISIHHSRSAVAGAVEIPTTTTTSATAEAGMRQVKFSFENLESFGGALAVMDHLVVSPTNGSAACLFTILYCSYYATKCSSSASFSLELKPLRDALRLGLHWHCRYLLCSASEGVRSAVLLRQALAQDLDSDTRVSLTAFLVDLVTGAAASRAAAFSAFTPELLFGANDPDAIQQELGDARNLAALLDDSDATVCDLACRMCANGLYHEWTTSASVRASSAAPTASITSALLSVLARLQSTRIRSGLLKIVRLLVVIIRSRASVPAPAATAQGTGTGAAAAAAAGGVGVHGKGSNATSGINNVGGNNPSASAGDGLKQKQVSNPVVVAARSFSIFIRQCLDVILMNPLHYNSSAAANTNSSSSNSAVTFNNNADKRRLLLLSLPPSLPLICGITRIVLESCIAQSERPFFEFFSSVPTSSSVSSSSNGNSVSASGEDQIVGSAASFTFATRGGGGGGGGGVAAAAAVSPMPQTSQASQTFNDDFMTMFEKKLFTVSPALVDSIGGSATLWRMYRGLRVADDTSTTLQNQTCCRLRYFILRILVCLMERTSASTIKSGSGGGAAVGAASGANSSGSVGAGAGVAGGGGGGRSETITPTEGASAQQRQQNSNAASGATPIQTQAAANGATPPVSAALSTANINNGQPQQQTLTTTSDMPNWKFATSDPNAHCSALVCNHIIKSISEPFELDAAGNQPPFVLANQLLDARIPLR